MAQPTDRTQTSDQATTQTEPPLNESAPFVTEHLEPMPPREQKLIAWLNRAEQDKTMMLAQMAELEATVKKQQTMISESQAREKLHGEIQDAWFERTKLLEDAHDLTGLINAAHKTAKEHGWWEGATLNYAEKIALMHSELSEGLEELRAGKPSLYYENDKPEGLYTEFADVLIRIFDLVGYMGGAAMFVEAVSAKMIYNNSRPYKHGGKKF